MNFFIRSGLKLVGISFFALASFPVSARNLQNLSPFFPDACAYQVGTQRTVINYRSWQIPQEMVIHFSRSPDRVYFSSTDGENLWGVIDFSNLSIASNGSGPIACGSHMRETWNDDCNGTLVLLRAKVAEAASHTDPNSRAGRQLDCLSRQMVGFENRLRGVSFDLNATDANMRRDQAVADVRDKPINSGSSTLSVDGQIPTAGLAEVLR